MGFFDVFKKSSAPAEDLKVQNRVDSVAVAKKRMNKTKSQRAAEEAEWAADDAELAKMQEEEETGPGAQYNPGAKPATGAIKKSAMKQKSKFVGKDQEGMSR
jgi:hypothetical protein